MLTTLLRKEKIKETRQNRPNFSHLRTKNGEIIHFTCFLDRVRCPLILQIKMCVGQVGGGGLFTFQTFVFGYPFYNQAYNLISSISLLHYSSYRHLKREHRLSKHKEIAVLRKFLFSLQTIKEICCDIYICSVLLVYDIESISFNCHSE